MTKTTEPLYRHLFVYGTLKADHPNSERFGLAGTCECTPGVDLMGYRIYNLSWFPGIIPGEGVVIGDLFKVPEELFERLDKYEGCPTLYKRESVCIGSIPDVQIYVYQGTPLETSFIESGVWKG